MANEFKTTVGGKVSKKDAQDWIAQYDQDHRRDKDKDVRSVFFGKEFLQQVLNTESCTGISFFFAKKDNPYAGKKDVALVLVPTKEDGTLIWPTLAEGKDDPGEGAYDTGLNCPPYCPNGTGNP